MAKLADQKIGNSYGDLVTVEADPLNSGINADLQYITDGNNARSPLRLSLTKAQVKPSTNSSTAFEVKNSSGDSCLTVDTTDKKVTAGANAVNVLHQQEIFGWQAAHDNISADDWYSMCHGGFYPYVTDASGGYATSSSFGNFFGDGDQPNTYNANSTSENTVYRGHYNNVNACRLFHKIKLDSVVIHYIGRFIHGSGDSTLPVFECKLMQYNSIDNFNGMAGGLNNGSLMASHSGTLNCLFTEKTQILTIDDANVVETAPIRVLVPCVRLTTVGNVDLMVKMYVNYHIV